MKNYFRIIVLFFLLQNVIIAETGQKLTVSNGQSIATIRSNIEAQSPKYILLVGDANDLLFGKPRPWPDPVCGEAGVSGEPRTPPTAGADR